MQNSDMAVALTVAIPSALQAPKAGTRAPTPRSPSPHTEESLRAAQTIECGSALSACVRSLPV